MAGFINLADCEGCVLRRNPTSAPDISQHPRAVKGKGAVFNAAAVLRVIGDPPIAPKDPIW
jgi:hypothetical protein